MLDITPLRNHSSLMNCFNKGSFLRFYNELKFHSLPRDGKMRGRITRNQNLHQFCQNVDITPLCSRTLISRNGIALSWCLKSGNPRVFQEVTAYIMCARAVSKTRGSRFSVAESLAASCDVTQHIKVIVGVICRRRLVQPRRRAQRSTDHSIHTHRFNRQHPGNNNKSSATA